MNKEQKEKAAVGGISGGVGFLIGYFWPKKKQGGGGELVLSDITVNGTEFGDTLNYGYPGLDITVGCKVENTGPSSRQATVVTQIANQIVSQAVNVSAGAKIPVEIQSVLPDMLEEAWNISVSIEPLVKSITLMNPS